MRGGAGPCAFFEGSEKRLGEGGRPKRLLLTMATVRFGLVPERESGRLRPVSPASSGIRKETPTPKYFTN